MMLSTEYVILVYQGNNNFIFILFFYMILMCLAAICQRMKAHYTVNPDKLTLLKYLRYSVIDLCIQNI